MTDHTASRIARGVRRALTALAVVGLVAALIGADGTSVALAGPSLVPSRPSRPPPAARPSPPPGLSGKLNLNTATAAELERLPGVGPTKARRVLEFRGAHGPFRRVMDLRRVKGFGKKTVDRLAPFLTISEPTTLAGR
jgi:competence protein ComEA